MATPSETVRRYASIAHAAEFADTHPDTIRRLISSGKLTGYRIGAKVVRVNLVELDALFVPIGGAHNAVDVR